MFVILTICMRISSQDFARTFW